MALNIILFISICFNIMFFAVGVKFILYRGGMKYLKLVVGNVVKHRKIISGTKASVNRVKGFDNYKTTDEDIVFFGDSITHLGEWNEYFPRMSCRNRGNGGDKTYHILNRIDQIIKGNPKKIFLLVGINDLIGQVKKDEIIANYERILNRFTSEIPNTKVYAESILPMNTVIADDVYVRNYKTVITATNTDIEEVNTKIEELCRKYNVTYVDAYSKLINQEGQMPEGYTVDGVHLYQEGYLALADILKEYVTEYERVSA